MAGLLFQIWQTGAGDRIEVFTVSPPTFISIDDKRRLMALPKKGYAIKAKR